MSGQPILTVSEMRAAEERIIASGTSVETLMERVGAAVAEAVRHFGGGMPALVVCGPGNNGGDGYVVARCLQGHGVSVRLAALGEPKTPAAIAARKAWDGPVESLSEAKSAPMLIDALFGTGLTRGLEAAVSDQLARLAAGAMVRVAVDLPSGIATDDGTVLSPVPEYAMTVALGALKPAHLLQPAARFMGRLVVADIGLGAIESAFTRIVRPQLKAPGPDTHKYSRGMVAVIGGAMPGAALLAAMASQRAGAGYVVLTGAGGGGPAALVHRDEEAALADRRVGAVVIGPGLGRDAVAAGRLNAALAADRPLVIDADALMLLGIMRLAGLGRPVVLTPHEGEFAHLFGEIAGSKIERVCEAARRADAVVLLKGADSVVAHPDGRVAIAPPGPGWLASAGTGDVLAGIIAALIAQGFDAFQAVQAALWLHAEAARLAGPALIADDLIQHLPAAIAACL